MKFTSQSYLETQQKYLAMYLQVTGPNLTYSGNARFMQHQKFIQNSYTLIKLEVTTCHIVDLEQ